jgi:hypothetical protein
MKKITEIYDTYRIFSGLREHQVRVAAVASTIVNAAYEPLPKEAIIAACLLHDMGNIIKAPLGSLPELLEPEGISYWQTVKEDFVKTYGLDEHIATVRIAREIGVSNEVIHLIESFGFGKSFLRRDSMTLPEKICGYADMRVGPFGIISLEERLRDLSVRYAQRRSLLGQESDFESLCEAQREVEKQIFGCVDVRPEDITDDILVSVRPMMLEVLF